MKNKANYLNWGSFALLFFVVLGYVVKFYPQTLSALDRDFQVWLRGDLPNGLNTFFRAITVLGNTPVIFALTALLAAFFYYLKKWRAESLLLAGNMALMGLLSTSLKYAYNRPRPDLSYLIEKPLGPSFPSWHAASSMILALSLAIIIQQRAKTQTMKRMAQLGLILLAVLVALSRIYLGVHYPTDIIAGWLLAATLVFVVYPFYDQKRFVWRFRSEQK